MTTAPGASLASRERMTALAAAQPLSLLCSSLLVLDAKPDLTEAGRITRAVIIDAICERSPEADAAFQAWAESDDYDPHAAVLAIVGAVKAA